MSFDKRNQKGVVSLSNSIQDICGEFIENVLKILENGENVQLHEIEEGFGGITDEFLRSVMAAYLREIDAEVLKDKDGRRESGLSVERRGDSRTVNTKYGPVSYERTYYTNEKEEYYEYTADKVVGIERYERISIGLSRDLVAYASEVSYAKSSLYGCKGYVSRQSVLNAVRKIESKERFEKCKEKRNVKILHISADEDHVALQTGRNTQVPIVTVYEGLKRESKNRNRCINAWNFSEYGLSNQGFWECVEDYIEEHYEVDKIDRIYIHGDGAPWIKGGCQYLFKSVFVLDEFHVNQALMRATGAQPGKRRALRESINKADWDSFNELCASLHDGAITSTEKDRIQTFYTYITNNWEAIEIKIKEVCGGCCAEGHVSHVLSSRLSSRPMGWSKKTLKPMTVLLSKKANKTPIKITDFVRKTSEVKPLENNAVSRVKKKIRTVNPDALWKNYSLHSGKITPIYRVMKGISM